MKKYISQKKILILSKRFQNSNSNDDDAKKIIQIMD